MKKSLLFAIAILGWSSYSVAQCNPNSHDWGAATYGVSPDPTLGENFLPAQLGVAYHDIVFVLAPTSAADVSDLAPAGTILDSLRLDSITINNGIANISIEAVGLSLTCNNNGDLPNSCAFLPGHAYCGDINGVPSVVGSFPVNIYATAFARVPFGPALIPVNYQTTYSNYVFNITDPNTVAEEEIQSINVGQNAPNPANDYTSIDFDLGKGSTVDIVVSNLLGERVITKKITGKVGRNNVKMDTSELQSGVYLYSVQSGEKKFTKRMLVQH
jgi:Secretion system C-terminal sorting domain